MTLSKNAHQKSETYVFGGSFNPPTLAHMSIVETALQQVDCAEVWILPSGSRADKTIDVDDKDRLNMLELMISELSIPRLVEICTVELDMSQPTQTTQTVQELNRRHPNKSFRYVFGADSYASMPDWKNGEYLQNELSMLIVGRDEIEVDYTSNVTVVNQTLGISSSEVRQRVLNQQSISGFVCDSVARYISDNGVYVQAVGVQ